MARVPDENKSLAEQEGTLSSDNSEDLSSAAEVRVSDSDGATTDQSDHNCIKIESPTDIRDEEFQNYDAIVQSNQTEIDRPIEPTASVESSEVDSISRASAPEMPPPPPASAAPPKTPNLPAHLAQLVQKTQETAKTLLDHIALRETLDRATAEKQIKVKELMLERANEPAKPFTPIEKYRAAAACESVWENKDPNERVAFCGRCKLQVYDFTGLELPEAEELIFKREDLRNQTLYKRKDGKFLTRNCPVGSRRRQQRIIAISAGTLLVVGLITWLATMPPPPKPQKVAAPAAARNNAVKAAKPEDTSIIPVSGVTPSGAPSAPTESNSPPLIVKDANGNWTYAPQAQYAASLQSSQSASHYRNSNFAAPTQQQLTAPDATQNVNTSQAQPAPGSISLPTNQISPAADSQAGKELINGSNQRAQPASSAEQPPDTTESAATSGKTGIWEAPR